MPVARRPIPHGPITPVAAGALYSALFRLVAADNCNYERDTMRSEGYFDDARAALAQVPSVAEHHAALESGAVVSGPYHVGPAVTALVREQGERFSGRGTTTESEMRLMVRAAVAELGLRMGDT